MKRGDHRVKKGFAMQNPSLKQINKAKMIDDPTSLGLFCKVLLIYLPRFVSSNFHVTNDSSVCYLDLFILHT